jgi:hypothetical protein
LIFFSISYLIFVFFNLVTIIFIIISFGFIYFFNWFLYPSLVVWFYLILIPNLIIVFSIMIFKPNPGVDPWQVLDHRSSWLTKVTTINLTWKKIFNGFKKKLQRSCDLVFYTWPEGRPLSKSLVMGWAGWPRLPGQLNFLFYKYVKMTLFWSKFYKKKKSMGFLKNK